MENAERLLKVTFLVTIMLLAPIAGVAGTAGGASTASDGGDVSVWEESPLSLQADTGDASVSVALPTVQVNTTDSYPDTILNRSKTGVYDANDNVTLRFGDDVDATEFSGKDVELLVGYSETGPTAPMTLDLSDENVDELNDEYTFRTEPASIEDDGTFTEDVELEEGAGYYTFAVVDGDVSFDENDDLESVSGTLLGVERIIAHEEPSAVDVDDSPEPGDEITFNATATAFEGSDVEHTVVLYHEETFTDSLTTLTITDDLNADLSEENITVESEIGSINGVHTVADDTDERTVNGTLSVEEIVGFVTDDDRVDDVVTTGDQQLNASSVAVLGDANEELTVETLDEWDEGDYQWIHVASGTETDQVQVNGGQIALEASSGGIGGGIGGIGGGGAPVDPEFEVTKAGLSASEIAAGDSVDVTATVEEVSGDRGGQFTAELIVDGEVVDEQTVTVFGGSSEDVTFTRSFDEIGEYEIEVNDVSAGTLTVSEDGPGGSGTAEFVVSDPDLSATQLQVGEDLEVTATVENTGDAAGTYTATLTVDGQIVNEEAVTLDSGESTTVSFTHSFAEAGEYTIAIGETNVGTVSIEDDGGLLPVPGFGAPAALAALLSLAVIGARLQETEH